MYSVKEWYVYNLIVPIGVSKKHAFLILTGVKGSAKQAVNSVVAANIKGIPYSGKISRVAIFADVGL